MRFPRNYHEDERDEGDPLPKDASGQTIIPTQADILKGCETVQRLKREAAEANLARRRWDQR